MGFATRIARLKRELPRPAATILILRATDFLTGSPYPAFARAVGLDRVVIDINQAIDEPYDTFEARALVAAEAAGECRLIFGGSLPPSLRKSLLTISRARRGAIKSASSILACMPTRCAPSG
jgi:hypothetical protein